MVNDLTVVCAWSNEEAARYIETFKAYENKPPDSIKERVDDDYVSKLTDCLTQIQSVNKTDVVTLASTFGVSFLVVVKRKRAWLARKIPYTNYPSTCVVTNGPSFPIHSHSRTSWTHLQMNSGYYLALESAK